MTLRISLRRHRSADDRHAGPPGHRPVAEEVTESLPVRRGQTLDAPWLPVVRRLGFADVAGYLKDRHLPQELTVNAIATEVGTCQAGDSALSRHGAGRTAHAFSRGRRAGSMAARFGFLKLEDYLAQLACGDLPWRRLAEECAQPQT